MTRFSALISALLCFASMSAQTMVGKRPLPEGEVVRYNSMISFRGNGVSGICLLKANETGLVGSIVNEFGIKAMDFTYDKEKGKVKLLNVVKFLDKWYIRKIVKADLSCMLRASESQAQKHRNITVGQDGTLALENTKYHITYNLTPIEENAVKE